MKYALSYKDLNKEPMKIDFRELVQGFRLNPSEKVYAIMFLALILAALYMAFAHVKIVDHNSMTVYKTPIENHRISPRTNTSDYLFNTIKQ